MIHSCDCKSENHLSRPLGHQHVPGNVSPGMLGWR